MREVVMVAVINSKTNNYLVLHRHEHSPINPDSWEFPTAQLRYDTDIHELALSQLRKETKLHGLIKFAGKPILLTDELGEIKIYPVHVEVNKESVQIRNKEHTEFRWVQYSELTSLKTLPVLLQVLKQLHLPDGYVTPI